jgi:hypothetical protein
MHTECRSTENRELSTLELDVIVGGNSREAAMTPAQRTAKAGEDYRHDALLARGILRGCTWSPSNRSASDARAQWQMPAFRADAGKELNRQSR